MYCYACAVEGVALSHINSLPPPLSSSSPTTCEKEQQEEEERKLTDLLPNFPWDPVKKKERKEVENVVKTTMEEREWGGGRMCGRVNAKKLGRIVCFFLVSFHENSVRVGVGHFLIHSKGEREEKVSQGNVRQRGDKEI